VRPRQSIERQRRFSPKTRDGCLVCKKRRVKCDERKPTCIRCARSGLQCDGYAIPQAILFDYDGSGERQRRFAFYFNHVVPTSELRSDADRKFWGYTVLQASHSEPAVKHAMLAISAWHHGQRNADTRSEDYNDTHRHYGLAIRAAHRATYMKSSRDISDLFNVSMALLSLELFRRDSSAGRIHLQACRNLLGAAESLNIRSGFLRDCLSLSIAQRTPELSMLQNMEHRLSDTQ
jgi:hypothetical protein